MYPVQLLKKVARIVIPNDMITRINVIRIYVRKHRILLRMKKYFSDKPYEARQYTQEIDFIKNKGFQVFPYYKMLKNLPEVDVHFDEREGMFWVNHKGLPLYFPRSMNRAKVISYYCGICQEQFIESPHRYFSENYYVTKDYLFVDVGSAEAMSSLEVANIAKSIIIFECDPEWIEALNMTFKPWKEKVEIVCKYVSDRIEENTTTLDEKVGQNSSPIFIKMDIEGYEEKALTGAVNVLAKPDTKIVCCTYHKNNSAKEIMDFLNEQGLETSFSDGYMLMCDKDIQPPFFRKGVIRACHHP